MKKTKTIFIYPDAGLGNRLNCIYSGIYWSKLLNYKLKILWEIDLACCISFKKLFEIPPDIDLKTIYTMPVKYKPFFRSLIGKHYVKKLKEENFYISSEKTCQLFSNKGENGIRELILDPNEYCIKSFGTFANWEHISEVTDLLKPAPDIKKRVQEILCPYICMNKTLIGIHIRRTDHRLAIEKSPLYVFTNQMQKIIIDLPNTYFYLATDDENVEKELSDKFPIIPKKCFSDLKSRKTEAGMMDAYVDMLCLSKCRKIYGSYGSTFSKMASVIGGKKYIILQK